MREGGLDVAFFVVYVGQEARSPEADARALEMAVTKFEAIHRLTEQIEDDPVPGGSFAKNYEHIIMPMAVMGTALVLVAFVPLLFY